MIDMNYIKKLTVSLMLLMAVACVYSQERPKLVVGIVVDQMRWDYLYRYYDRYAANGGFKRLMNNGFNCQNTMINYIPSFTAVGHSSIYTGSVPSIHGITGNSFVIQQTGTLVSAVRDDSVRAVGTDNQKAGQVSPKIYILPPLQTSWSWQPISEPRWWAYRSKTEAVFSPQGTVPMQLFGSTRRRATGLPRRGIWILCRSG